MSCGVLYCANRILGSTGPLIVPALADLLMHVLLVRNMLRSSTGPACVAKETYFIILRFAGINFELTCNAMPSAHGT